MCLHVNNMLKSPIGDRRWRGEDLRVIDLLGSGAISVLHSIFLCNIKDFVTCPMIYFAMNDKIRLYDVIPI